MGHAPAGAAPEHRLPARHRRRPVPGRRRAGRHRPGDQADRAGHLRHPAPGAPPVRLREQRRPRGRAVLLRDEREGRARDDRAEPATAGLPQSVTPQVSALNINASPVIVASVSGANGASEADLARIVQTEIVPELQSLEGVSAADATGGLTKRVQITLDPAKLTESGVSVGQISGVLQANNITLPAGSLPLDGGSVPVSTTHAFTPSTRSRTSSSASRASRPARAPRARSPARARPAPARPAARPPPRAPATPPAARRHAHADPARRPREGRGGRRLDDRLRADERRAVPHAHRQQEQRREHGLRRRRGDGQARRAQGRPPRPERGRRQRPLRVHQGVARRAAPRGPRGRAHGDPRDLPVPALRPLHLRRGGEHPHVDPRRAHPHARRGHLRQHHDPGRPRGRHRPRGGRRDRRPGEHLPAPRARRRQADRRPPARARSHRRSRAPRSRRSRSSCRSASSAASSRSSSCPSRSR